MVVSKKGPLGSFIYEIMPAGKPAGGMVGWKWKLVKNASLLLAVESVRNRSTHTIFLNGLVCACVA